MSAVHLNEARQSAIFERLTHQRAGEMLQDWPEDYQKIEHIRRPLALAEARVRDLVGVRHPTGDTFVPNVASDIKIPFSPLLEEGVREMLIERTHRRLNASWSYVDVVSWERLIRPKDTPFLFQLCLPLGKPHKRHMVIAEEHNKSGVHFHYSKLDGKRSDVLFSFGEDPPDPHHPIKWERHATGKAKFWPIPDEWNLKKRVNINQVCCAARNDLPSTMRFFKPSKEARFLLPM